MQIMENKALYEQLIKEEARLKADREILLKEIQPRLDKLDAQIKKIADLKKDYAPIDIAKTLIDVIGAALGYNYPIEWSKATNREQQVYVALNNIKEGYREDIAAELQRLDPKTFSAELADSIARNYLSVLKQKGIIEGFTFGIGPKLKYRIKKV